MNRHRGACIEPTDFTAWKLSQRSAPSDHSHLIRWEPWVRSYLFAQELNSHLGFHVRSVSNGRTDTTLPGSLTSAGGAADARLSVSLSVWAPGMSNRHTLVQLIQPDEQVFSEQIKRVLDWADLREERMPEVLAQIGNSFAFWGTLIPVHTDRLRNTRELLQAALQFAMAVEMRFKHELACWRPIDLSPQVQPMVSTPGHGALPSGHCTEAYVIKEVLEALLNMHGKSSAKVDNLRQQFARTAERIATNRVVAGVHFPIDNVAGQLLGVALGRFFVWLCGGAPKGQADYLGKTYVFDGSKCPADIEFDPDAQKPTAADGEIYRRIGQSIGELGSPPGLLDEAWRTAMAEISQLGLKFA